MPTRRITGAVLARNEEANIEFCLRSLYTWCDELIVVDMRSSDRTREIASRYTDKVLDHEPIVEFDLARQVALDHATSEWFLSIDADEVVTPQLADWIRTFARLRSTLRSGAHPAGERLSGPLAAQHAVVAR